MIHQTAPDGQLVDVIKRILQTDKKMELTLITKQRVKVPRGSYKK